MMNKSTPINQLPIQNSVSRMPQMPPPAMNNKAADQATTDDDATIQDVLNKLNTEPTSQSDATDHQFGSNDASNEYSSLMMDATQPHMQHMTMQDHPNMMGHSNMYMSDYQGEQPYYKTKLLEEILSFNDGIKLSLIAGILFVAIYMLPVEKLAYKYISIEHIPNSNLLIKSLSMVIFMFISQKFL